MKRGTIIRVHIFVEHSGRDPFPHCLLRISTTTAVECQTVCHLGFLQGCGQTAYDFGVEASWLRVKESELRRVPVHVSARCKAKYRALTVPRRASYDVRVPRVTMMEVVGARAPGVM